MMFQCVLIIEYLGSIIINFGASRRAGRKKFVSLDDMNYENILWAQQVIQLNPLYQQNIQKLVFRLYYLDLKMFKRISKLCEELCPKKKKREAYDVHEETFEMEENYGYDSQKNSSAPTTTNQAEKKSQSQECLSSQTKNEEQQKLQQDQKKFIQNKNKIDEDKVLSPKKKQQVLISVNTNLLDSKDEFPATTQVPSIQIQQPKQQVKQQPKPKPKYNILPTGAKKKKFNPEDFYFKQQQNQFKVKPVDSIKGQQFNIDGCKNGRYFIFDISANIYIDDCQDCIIYTAPVESSIFVRSCKNMIIIAAVGQFRTYNCHDCHFSVYCKSQPVIESSSNIHFSTFTCPQYKQLRQQFQKTNLFPWNNNWSQIHNFTKKAGQVHYFLDQTPTFIAQIDWQRAFNESKLQKINDSQQIIPFIQGALPLKNLPNRKLLILNDLVSKQDELITKWVKEHNIRILRASKSKPNGQKQSIVALLIDYQGSASQLNLQQIGNPLLIQQKQEIDNNQNKYFVVFKDQRQG